MCVVKQQTAYELRIRDWSSDVCSSDLHDADRPVGCDALRHMHVQRVGEVEAREHRIAHRQGQLLLARRLYRDAGAVDAHPPGEGRSEEHTSELQSLMRTSSAVFCLKNKNNIESQMQTPSQQLPLKT